MQCDLKNARTCMTITLQQQSVCGLKTNICHLFLWKLTAANMIVHCGRFGMWPKQFVAENESTPVIQRKPISTKQSFAIMAYY